MIDELTLQRIKRFDRVFRTKSRAFPLANIIVVETPFDQCEQWEIEITSNIYKKYMLYHKDKASRKNKHHLQGWRRSLWDTYDSISNHKRILRRSKSVHKRLKIKCLIK